MNKLNLYIFKITNKYILINLILILILVTFINLIEISRSFNEVNYSLSYYFYLILLKIPTMINEILPFVIIISIAFLFRYLINNNELTSMRNIGHSIFDIFLPVSISIFLFGCLNLFFLNPISANFEKQYEKILNKKNQDVYTIKISSDIMRIKNINDKQGLNFIEIKKIDVNNMIANDIKILKIDDEEKKLILAKEGRIKDKKFLLDDVKIYNINQNIYKQKKNIKLDLNFSRENIINSIVNYRNVPFYDYLNHTKILKKFNLYSSEISLYYISQILNPLFIVILGFVVLGFSAKFRRNENLFKILFTAILIGFMIFFFREIIYKITVSYSINFIISYLLILFLPLLIGLYKVVQIEND